MVATRNRKKLKEIREILKGLRLRIVSLADFHRPPRIVEDGKTFRENAAKKALKVARFTGMLTLGEDSGLCVDALGGRPGVYSSRFSGRGKSDEKNNLKLLKLLAGVPAASRKAHYVCAVALADRRGLLKEVEGRCSGRIGLEPRGRAGFGYDPLFVVPGYGKTFAELGPRIKHTISHRFRALRKARRAIVTYLKENPSDV